MHIGFNSMKLSKKVGNIQNQSDVFLSVFIYLKTDVYSYM